MKNGMNRICILFLSMILIVAMAVGNPMTANALTDADAFLEIVNSKYDFEGSGTEEDPYQISSYEDLCTLRDSVDVGVTYRNIYFVQTADITFPDGENWNPIGDMKKDYAFFGIYDGQGHVLLNIYCDDQFAGLFAWLKGEVRNLGIESGEFTGATIGSITSHGSEAAKIINCYNKATVSGTARAGGLTDNYGGQILYSWNFGEVVALKKTAATAGITSYSGYGTAAIQYSYSTTCDDLVVEKNYNGTVSDSAIVTAEEIPGLLEEMAARLGRGQVHKDLSHENITFMAYERDSMVFVKAAPNAYWMEFAKSYFMMALLALAGAVMGVVALVKRPWEYQVPAAAPRKPAAKPAAEAEVVELTPEDKKRILIKRVVAVVLTLVMFIGAFSYVNGVLTDEYAAGTLNLAEYKSGETPPDVLLMGSSTMATNIEVVDLWNNYGIASHCLAGAGASMQDNYYRLLSAEEAHVPNMVILDVKAVTHTNEYASEESRLKNITGVDLTLTKLSYISAALPMEQRMDFLINLPLYHTRYDELTWKDFLHTSVFGEDDKGNWSIFYGNQHNPTLVDANEINNYRAIGDKPEYYLRKIIEHCQEKGITLLLIKTPDAARKKDQPYYNTVSLIAEEYGVPFLDMNRMDEQTGLVGTDFYYDNDHLNVVGARKCTKLLGEYLEANYDLPDRRGNEDYNSWVRYVALKDQLYMMQMRNSYDYIAELERNNKKLIMVTYDAEEITAQAYTDFVARLDGVDHLILAESSEGVFGSVKLKTELGLKSATLTVEDKNGINEYSIASAGAILLVYDDVLDEVSDIVVFSEGYDYTLHRLYWAR